MENFEELLSCTHTLYDGKTVPGEIGDTDIDFVCFSGGGVRGIAFVGALLEMERRGLYQPKNPKIHYWVGSSAGAICAALASLGMPSQTMREELIKTNLRNFFDVGGRSSSGSWWSKFQEYPLGLSELIGKWGAARCDEFTRWFEQKMRELDWDPDMTLIQLYRKTGQHLIVTTTSLNTHETLYLSRSSYPNMRIVDAVRASIIYPFVFQPIRMRDPSYPERIRILVDGGLLDNFPLNACDVLSKNGEVLGFNRKAIGFTLLNHGKWAPDYVHISNLLNYAMTFLQSMHKRIHIIQSQQPYFWDRVVPIETYGIDTMNFDASQEKLEKLIQSGEESTRMYLDERDTMILEKGPLPRNLFIPNPRFQIDSFPDDFIQNTQIYQTNPSRH